MRSRQPFGPSAADLLELAVADGYLVPGARRWKTRQQELVQAHMDAPRAELLGQSLAAVIVSERAETGVSTWRSQTRRWLLAELDGGIPLTQTGNLSRAFVQQNAGRFGWDVSRPPRTEDDLYDLHQLRCLARELRLAGRSSRVLTLTGKGRRLLADPGRVGADNLVAAADLVSCAGERRSG